MFSKSDELDKVIKAINDLNEKIYEKDIEIALLRPLKL